MNKEANPGTPEGAGGVEWKLIVPDGPLPRRAWVECKIDGLAPHFIVPNVRFGDACIPPDPIFWASQLEKHCLPARPLSEEDAKARPDLVASMQMGANSCLALLTDQRMKDVYEELLKRSPKTFYYEKARKGPFKDPRPFVRYLMDCGLSNDEVRATALGVANIFKAPEGWSHEDRCVNQHLSIISLLHGVMGSIVWAPMTPDGGKLKSVADLTATAERVKSIEKHLRSVAKLMQTPGMLFPADDLADVRRIADSAAKQAASLEWAITGSPLTVARDRGDLRLRYFVLHTASLTVENFGKVIPSVVATLAEVVGIAPKVAASTVEKMVASARWRGRFPPPY